MADHAYFEELIMAAADGEIAPEEEAELRAHLESCEQCRAFMETMEAVSGVSARDLPPAPAGFAEGVMAQIRSAAPEKKKAKILSLPVRTLSLAAVAALVLWVGFRIAPAFASKSASGATAPQSVASSAGGSYTDSAAAAQPAAVPTEEEAAAEEAPPPQSAMFGGVREDKDAGTPAENNMNAAAEEPECEAAPEAARQNDSLSSDGTTYTIYAGEDLQAEPLYSGSDPRTAELLTPGELCRIPDRTADYTLVATDPEGGETVFLLWKEDGAVAVLDTARDAAGWSAAGELLEELLQ